MAESVGRAFTVMLKVLGEGAIRGRPLATSWGFQLVQNNGWLKRDFVIEAWLIHNWWCNNFVFRSWLFGRIKVGV